VNRISATYLGGLISSLAICAPAGAQTTSIAGATVDHRESPLPAVRWSTGQCMIAYGTARSGPPEGFLEVYSATRTSAGATAVMDAKAKTLLLFDADGRFQTRAGGRGNGPGEFATSLPVVFPYRGDSLLVFESMTSRAQIFSSSGRYVRGFRIEAEPGWQSISSIVGTMADGRLIATRRRHGPPGSVYVRRDSVSMIWFDRDGHTLRANALVPDVMLARREASDPPVRSGGSGGGVRVVSNVWMEMVAAGPVVRAEGPLGLSSWAFAARGDAAYRLDEARDALEVYSSDGVLVRTILLRPLPEALRPGPAKVRPLSEAQVLELRVDELSRAWLEVARDRLDGDRKWWVFDRLGRWVAEATTPPARDRILEIGSQYVLLRKKDQDDVQTVAYCPIAAR
jgi:hypothetical protein